MGYFGDGGINLKFELYSMILNAAESMMRLWELKGQWHGQRILFVD